MNFVGLGRTVLNNTSTYVGNVTVSSGAVQLGNVTALNSNAINVTGGVLEGGVGGGTFANAITLGGGALATTGGNATYSGGVTLTASTSSVIALWDPTNGNNNRNVTIGTNAVLGSGNLVVGGIVAQNGGILNLTAAGNNYTGSTTVSNGILSLNGAGTLGTSGNFTSALNLINGATLNIDNSGGNVADRVNDNIPFAFNGGTVSLLSVTASAVAGAETIGAVNLNGGNNTINVNRGNGGAPVTLTLTSLTRSAGAALNISATNGALGAAGNNSQVLLLSPPVGPTVYDYATANGGDIAVYDTNGFRAMVDGAGATDYAASGTALTASRYDHANASFINSAPISIKGLRIDNGVTLTNNAVLTFSQTPAMITRNGGGTVTTIAGSGSIAVTNELIVSAPQGGITINQAITGSGGLDATGGASIVFGGTAANTYGGATYADGSPMTLSKLANVVAIPGDLVINGNSVTESTGEQIAATSNVTINNYANAGSLGLPTVAGVNQTINSLTINTLGQTGDLPNNGGTLTLAGSGTVLTMTAGNTAAPIDLASSGASVTIHDLAPSTILAPTVATVGGPYEAQIAGALNLNTSATGGLTRTFNIDDGPAVLDMVVSSVISDTMLAGITKTGNGTLQFTATNTYGGLTTVNGGTLSLNGTGVIPIGGLTVNTGGTLRYDANTGVNGKAFVTVSGGTINFNNRSDTYGGLTYTSGTINLPLSNTLTIDPSYYGQALTLQGTSLSGNLTLPSTSFINTVASSTTASIAGVLNTPSNQGPGQSLYTALIFNVAAGTTGSGIDLDVPASLQGTSGPLLLKIGAGTMRLSGTDLANQNASGDYSGFNVLGGTLILAKNIPGVTGAALPAGNSSTPGWFAVGRDATAPAAKLVLAGNEQLGPTTGVVVSPYGTFDLGGYNQTLADLEVGQEPFSGYQGWGGNGNNNNSNWSSWVTLAPGGSVISTGGNSTLNITFAPGTSTNPFTSGSLVLNGATINLGAGSKIVGPAGAGGLSISNALVANLSTISTPIAGGNISKVGHGTILLNAADTYTGTTNIYAGTLRVGNANAIPATSPLFLGSDTNFSGPNAAVPTTVVLDVNGFGITVPNLSSTAPTTAGINIIALGAAGSITYGADDSAQTYTGLISGSAAIGTMQVTKNGSGTETLGLTNPFGYTGDTVINNGALKLAATNALPVLSSIIVNNNTSPSTFGVLDINNNATTIGSLAGNGTVTNSNTTTNTLQVGWNNSSTTFSGAFAASTTGLTTTASSLTVSKVGTGTMLVTGNASTDTGTFNVNGGGVTLSGNGAWAFATVNDNQGGTLTLDNTGAANVNNRLAVGSVLNLQGGTLVFKGSSTGSIQAVGALNIQPGASTFTLDASAAASGNTDFTVTGSMSLNIGGTALIRGINGSADGNNVANLFVGNMNFVGGQGADLNGTTTMPIRADIIADASTTGAGTGFLTRDTVTNYLRPLTAAELSSTLTSGASTTNNVGLSSVPATLTAQTNINSLTLQSGGGVVVSTATGAAPTQFIINTGGILDYNTNSGLTGTGVLNLSNGGEFLFHALGDLTLGLGSTANVNLVKDGSGNLTITTQQGYNGGTVAGTTYINAGTVTLNSGLDNTLPVLSNGTTPGPTALTMSGGTLELDGKSQMFGVLTGNANTLPGSAGSAGTIQNTANATTSTLTVTTGGSNLTFPGTITDNYVNPTTGGTLNLVKYATSGANNTLTLNNADPLHGSVSILGGGLTLADNGTLQNASAYNVQYGTLTLNNASLANINNRLNTSAPVSLLSSTLALTGAAGLDSSQALNTVTLVNGENTFNINTAAGGTTKLAISNLVRQTGSTLVLSGSNPNNVGPAFTGQYGEAVKDVGEVTLAQINGSAPAAGMIGGWAVVNSSPLGNQFWGWAVYDPTLGVQAMGFGPTNGQFVNSSIAYSNRSLFLAGPTDNINMGLIGGSNSSASFAGLTSLTINSLIGGQDTSTYNMADANQVLTLASGGFAGSANQSQFFNVGQVTSGGPELFLWAFSGGFTVNGRVVDGTGAAAHVALVASAVGTSTITLDGLNGSNSYTGGTVVNMGTGVFSLSARWGTVQAGNNLPSLSTVGTGGLTINNSTVTMNNFPGQIPASNAVTLNGTSALNLIGSNTLASVTFNGNGGAIGTPVVSSGTFNGLWGNLTLTGNITSTNNDPGATPTISGTGLSQLILGNGATITVNSGASPLGLVISSVITGGGASGIHKAGTGTLVLNNANSTTSSPMSTIQA